MSDLYRCTMHEWPQCESCSAARRLANWLYDELSQRGLPMVCIDARQAHAVLSQMHKKTDENDAAMLSELARTGFYKKIEIKSRLAQ